MHGTDWQTTQKAVGQLSDVNYLNKRMNYWVIHTSTSSKV